MGDRGRGRCLLLAFASAMVCALPAAASGATFHWSSPTAIDGAPFTQTHAVIAASCPTASLCVAADDHGDILTSTAPNGGAAGWHAARQVDPPSAFSAISCPSAFLCVAVSQSGDVASSKHPTGGSGAWRVARTVAGPNVPLVAVSCASASLCVAVDGKGGVDVSTHPAAGRSAWKRTKVIPAAQKNWLVGVACPSRSGCVAVDGRDSELAHSSRPGRAGSWSLTKLKTPRTHSYAAPAIACGSPKLCVIAGTTGGGDDFVVTSTDPLGGGRAWKASGHLPKQTGYLLSVSCPSATFCAATGYESPVIDTSSPRKGGRAWKVAYKLPPDDSENGPEAVSCQSRNLCVAVDPVGEVVTSAHPSQPPSWTVSLVDQVNSLDALSCASASFCVAGGTGGRLETSANPTGGAAGWSQSTLTLSPTTISCPTTGLCVASGFLGDDGLNIDASADPAMGASSWHVADTGGLGEISSVGGISCPSATLCIEPYYQVEDDSDGEFTSVLSSTDPAGGLSDWKLSDDFIDGGTNGGPGGGDGDVTAFSCASPTLCAGGDDAGRVFASTNPASSTWTKDRVDGRNAITAISCAPAGTVCVAVDAEGNVVTSSQPLTAKWKVTRIDPINGLTAVDCPAAGLCVAVDGAGDAFTSTNPTGPASAWKRVSRIDGDLDALSCPTTTLCLAVDGDGGLIVGHP